MIHIILKHEGERDDWKAKKIHVIIVIFALFFSWHIICDSDSSHANDPYCEIDIEGSITDKDTGGPIKENI